ncbi:MAG: HTH-type transcriptional repressor FabR [Moraxellaceae bacterium]|nr:HTH-type transcriptional repressor FabR [Moraxellaceae bacterium]MCP5178221.1 HTH-type transcriptional repressor FabR [Moraxellaceae bacterium]HQV22646.1 HTH-type transcriptional repressor FabR [Agitococcus sp.]
MSDQANTPPEKTSHQGRKAVISREDLINAALKLLGPQRSISSLSLREVARAADIAPNSFYRHFKDMDELAIALIDQAGRSLRKIIGEARQSASPQKSVIRTSTESFIRQLNADEALLHILLREGSVGSPAFKAAVERELTFFEEELCADLVRLGNAKGKPLFAPELVAKGMTRLVFEMGTRAMDLPEEHQTDIMEDTIVMLRMILIGSEQMAKNKTNS